MITAVTGVTFVCLFLCYTAGIEKQKTKTSVLCRAGNTQPDIRTDTVNTLK